MKTIRKAVLLLLCMVLALSGCTKTNETGLDTGNNGETAVVKGRYVEKMAELPKDIGHVLANKKTSDGTFILIGNKNSKDDVNGPWFAWESKDGSSWSEFTLSGIDTLNEMHITDVAFFSKEDWYLIGIDFSKFSGDEDFEGGTVEGDVISTSGDSTKDAEVETIIEQVEITTGDASASQEEPAKTEPFVFFEGEGETDSESESNHFLSSISLKRIKNGEVIELENMLRNQNFCDRIEVAENGDILLAYYKEIDHYDASTGQLKNTFELGKEDEAGDFAVNKNKIALISSDNLDVYDLETGESLNSYELQQSTSTNQPEGFGYDISKNKRISFDATGENYYYCDVSGIYRLMGTTGVVEKVVDGSMNSLSMPSISLYKLYVDENNDFLVQTIKNEIFTYKYDSNVVSVPSKELKVFSLDNNLTVRQAIAMFQNQHPDVKLTYEVGADENLGITRMDAIKNLSTKIIVGDGPDIIILDGMPINSYIEKDILADISDIVNAEISTGDVFENIVQTYKQKDKIYAVPSRFSVPIIAGENVSGISTLEQLNEYLTKNNETDNGISKTTINSIVKIFADDCIENKQINQEKLTELLSGIKAVSKTMDKEDENDEFYGDEMFLKTIIFANKKINTVVGFTNEVFDVAAIIAAIEKRGTGEFANFPDIAEKAYVPRSIYSINSQSAEMETAKEFVKFALSEEVLKNEFIDGFSVNKNALVTNFKQITEPDKEGEEPAVFYAAVDYGEEMLDIEFSNLKKEKIDEFFKMTESLAKPITEDAVVNEIMQAEIEKLIDNPDTSVEEVQKNINEKLALYLAE